MIKTRDQLFVVCSEISFICNIDGTYPYRNVYNSSYDLFIEVEAEKDMWVNLYRGGEFKFMVGDDEQIIFTSKEDAIQSSMVECIRYSNYLGTYKLVKDE